jgi:L-rhamnose mutarotase
MARYCFLLRVRPERMDEYRRRHAEMAAFFAELEGAPDEGLVLLDEVFHLEDQLGQKDR